MIRGRYHGTPEKQQWYKLCDTLVKHPRSVDAFHPLLALHGLETLVLDVHVRGFDDETLIKWASASPNLKIFKVSVTSVKNLITLCEVKTLLQRC